MFRIMDRRLLAILIAEIIAILLTLACYGLGFGRTPSTFFGAVFAAWIGSVVFFAFVGLAVAFVSIARSENESFHSRARILFKGQTGPHIEYAINRIKEFEHYAENSAKRFIIDDFHEPESKFWIVSADQTTIRSYIEDIPCTYNSRFEAEGVTAAPSGGNSNILKEYSIDGTPQATNVCFSTDIKRTFRTVIGPGKHCYIKQEFGVWFTKETEPFVVMVTRFTNNLIAEFVNRLGDKEIKVTVKKGGGQEETIMINPTQTHSFSLNDLEPDKPVFTFYVDLVP